MIEGILHMTQSGRWAVCRSGQSPIEISSGSVFSVEVDGKMRSTCMQYRHHQGGGGEYYSVDGYAPRDGMRASIVRGDGYPLE